MASLISPQKQFRRGKMNEWDPTISSTSVSHYLGVQDPQSWPSSQDARLELHGKKITRKQKDGVKKKIGG